MAEGDEDEELRARQDGRLYSLGRALRSTFDAENHDTLSSDVTGLMIDLSKVPYEPMAPDAAGPATGSSPARSWAARIGGYFGGR